MGLFGKLKDVVGVGSLKAEIVLTAPGFYPGDTLAGSVVLKDAATDTDVTSVLLELRRMGTDVERTDIVSEDYWGGTYWESYEKSFKVNEAVFEQFLAQDFVVAKGQRLELPFEITTPPDMAPSTGRTQWVLKAHVDLPGKMDCRVAKPVKIMVGGSMPMEPYPPGPTGDDGDLPSPGERVLAFFEDAWYECTVAAVVPGGISVNWDDGTSSVVSLEEVLPSESAVPGPGDLAPGQRVMARYDLGFYEATIATVQRDQAGIQWDDGTQSWIPLHDIRLL
jgi:hypothetical protein